MGNLTIKEKQYIYNSFKNNADINELTKNFNLTEDEILEIIEEMEENKDSEQNTDNIQDVENKPVAKHKIKNSIIMPIILSVRFVIDCVMVSVPLYRNSFTNSAKESSLTLSIRWAILVSGDSPRKPFWKSIA